MEKKTRICKVCGQELPIEKFGTYTKERVTKKSGIVEYTYTSKMCRECENEYRRKYIVPRGRKKKSETPPPLPQRPERTCYEATGIYTPEFLRGSATCSVCKRRLALADFPLDTNFQVYTKRVCNECHENN